MKIFDHMNTEGDDVCPICKTKDDKPTVLVPIEGTKDEGIVEAIQVHADCIELQYRRGDQQVRGIFYQIIDD
jgi:hypothetical protein